MSTEGDRERTGLLTTPEGVGNLITGYGAADHEDVEGGRARQPRAQNANAGPDGAADHEDMEGGRGAADLEDDVEGGPRAQNANTRAGLASSPA